jgi:hypothetical protein
MSMKLPLDKQGHFRLAPRPSHQSSSVALLAINFHDPSHIAHPDGTRANALQWLLHVPVYGLARRCEPSTATHLDSDLRNSKAWWSRHQHVDTVARRQTAVVILDYYWLQAGYFSSAYSTGYGDRWFATLLPDFMRHGGKIALLPNDAHGRIKEMSGSKTMLRLHFLTPFETSTHHPLWIATAAAESSPGWQMSVMPSQTHRTNQLAASSYLDKTYPFLMVYSADDFENATLAFSFLDSLRTMPIRQPLKTSRFL